MFRGWTESSGQQVLLRPERNSVERVIDLVFQFFDVRELMLDTCASISRLHWNVCSCLSIAGLLNVRRTLLVFKICFHHWWNYARQALSADANIIESDDAIETSKVFLKKKLAALASTKRVDSRTRPLKLGSIQTFPARMIYLVGNVFKDATLLEKCRHVILLQCSDRLRGRFNSIDMDTLLTLDVSAWRNAVKNSTILHLVAGLGFFF